MMEREVLVGSGAFPRDLPRHIPRDLPLDFPDTLVSDGGVRNGLPNAAVLVPLVCSELGGSFAFPGMGGHGCGGDLFAA